MPWRFEVLARDGSARRGRLVTSHGVVETPVFMPVGTQATVKGLTPDQLEDLGVRILLGNTYHLALRPGADLIAEAGGLHRFMGWNQAILTDSGGFQIYSLAPTRTITDEGAVFRSHIDGALFQLTPEEAVRIQEKLGSDIAMCLDECPPFGTPPDRLRDAVRRTIFWAERCRQAHRRSDQALFAIVQGATDLDLRAECAAALVRLDFPGYALGGFSVGETPEQMRAVLRPSAALLPDDKPRYLMGVGRPIDIVDAVAAGVDMFDCVLPTRNGRNAQAFTRSGTLKLRNAAFRRDLRPLDEGCACLTCRRFSRAYLHHLFNVDEMLGPILVSLHNLAHYLGLMSDIRQAIEQSRFKEFQARTLAASAEQSPSDPDGRV